ncbi:hypothetical protein V6N11_027604 [Hibiscus sabdariffa]|uniref:Uncharacterized protein n=2 Tax=Hibiscus sabdariffa TaxID=183260 RepID=A0ABR2D984_9ROSI
MKPLKSQLSVFQPTAENHRRPSPQQRGRERKSEVSFSSSSPPSYNYNYIHKKSGEFEEESAIGVYALATLHGESSGDNGDEVEGFLALQTGLAWVSTLVCMSFLEVLGFWRRKSGEEDGLWRGGRDRRGE